MTTLMRSWVMISSKSNGPTTTNVLKMYLTSKMNACGMSWIENQWQLMDAPHLLDLLSTFVRIGRMEVGKWPLNCTESTSFTIITPAKTHATQHWFTTIFWNARMMASKESGSIFPNKSKFTLLASLIHFYHWWQRLEDMLVYFLASQSWMFCQSGPIASKNEQKHCRQFLLISVPKIYSILDVSKKLSFLFRMNEFSLSKNA